MKTKIFIFFALVFSFRLFADTYGDCSQLKSDIEDHCLSIVAYTRTTTGLAADIAGAASPDQYSIIANARNIEYYSSSTATSIGHILQAVSSISCSSNDTCSVDLSPLAETVSNIYDVVSTQNTILLDILDNTDLLRLTQDDIMNLLNAVSYRSSSVGYFNVFDSSLFNAVSNFNNDVTSSFDVLTNQVANLYYTVDTFYNDSNGGFSGLLSSIQSLVSSVNSIYSNVYQIFNAVSAIRHSLNQYLPYVQTISNDLKILLSNSTNEFVLADYDFTNQLYASSLLGFDRFRYYAQGQSNSNQLQLYPLKPFDSASNLRNATIYDALSSGFASLLISQGSINNYLYWLKAMAGSNRLEAVEAHLVAVSNMVGRLDDYVLGDFSNEVVRLVETLSYVTNRVDYSTNLVEIVSLLETSTNHLASIDSKLDVLDYIKILSDTPLADYGGDIEYFDYLTNLYLSGVSSSGASTNWFERMEILLASLVFGDSDGTNGIPQSVEMEGFDSDTVSGAMSDFAFSEDFSTSVDNLSVTSHNFMQVLNSYSSSIHSVSLPATVSIGLAGVSASDTTNFEDLRHYQFQVSFKTGTSDRFTVVVRAVTTMSWVLLTLIFIWHCGFWILQKIQFFYRLMRLLINSIWLKS